MIDQEKIHNQCLSDDPEECIKALEQLRGKFLRLPDKQEAWNDLIRLASDQDSDVRMLAVDVLDSVISHVPNKKRAWNDLIKLINDEDSYVRSKVSHALGSAFSDVPDKQEAWNDLIRLTSGQDSDTRMWASSILVPVISDVPDKKQAWNDLHRLTNDEDRYVRYYAAYALGSLLSKVPDEQDAWNDLHRLINDNDGDVKRGAANAFCFSFRHMPDKLLAERDLHKLTTDGDSYVRQRAARILGSSFSHIPHKLQASEDLHRLTTDGNSYVRLLTANAIGSSFSHVQDQQRAWNDLIRLTTDKRGHVRTYANHSLGKISIFKASQAGKEEEYKRELEKAIEFFEIASQEDKQSSPSQFCLPFYRSFHTIIFKKQEAREQVDKYLAEAKDAVRGSKSKKLLFEAIENLANALKEVQNLENLGLEAKKGKLNFYRQYCDRAAELMRDTEETAPFATITMRKGLPILDRNLKELLEEIQKKAKIACKEAKGTDAEDIACAVSKEVQKWEIGSQEEMTQNIEGLIETFRMRMPHLPGYEHIFEEIEGIRNVNDLAKQYKIVFRLVGLIPIFSSMPDYVIQDIKEIKEKTTSNSNEIKYLQLSVDRLIESVNELQNQQEYLDTIQRTLEEIKNNIPEMKGKIDEVLYELYSPLSTDQKLKIAIPIIPALVSYEMETNVPKIVADKISELKNLVLRFKKDE